MTSSLVPEKPIQVSPSLASTIGLEEATMLSILDDLAQHRQSQWREGYQWLEIDQTGVAKHMPFWNDYDVQRISRSLRDKGILLLASAPYSSSRVLQFAFNERQQSAAKAAPAPRTHNVVTPGASLIPPNWQPSDETLTRIAQHNIPEAFVREQLPEFVTYWRESGESHRSWGSKFLQQIVRKWREHETFLGSRDQESGIGAHWRPSHDALEVLITHANINRAFVEDAIPEFVLYWQERGDKSRTWNSKFIQHVRRQWARFTSALAHDTEPTRLPENWQPGKDVDDILRLANIDADFAQQLLPEFILFWRDSNQLHTSWNTKFLQHVKYHWAKRHALTPYSLSPQANAHAGQQPPGSTSRTRDRSISEQLTDRSWAY
ncbi:hypothetical protein FKG94_26415 [Exilibacterium tricleocarpae]|uniref:DnaT DNA-binding domain-containing protein n=1 Tax=Exilibacterium tricleocarpae TaxID=2591008 RepID=A0A545SPU3_9GAMM|nr:DnaT-like ssDNA-binding domain-containing protein [Exilibacterium tricleocarpae]TQV67005.1 hypothetical protein FKG94_26415 [Exilibacterium tricleocarpae]